MVEMLTAYTFEADDPAYAIQEILKQLDMDHRLKRNAVGLLFCHSDFIETGVAQAIAERLPFDVAGGTTIASMTPDEADTLMLTLCVLTSDDVEFSSMRVRVTESLTEVGSAYREAVAGRDGKPALIMPIVPLLHAVGAETIMLALDEASGRDVPMFGTVVFDHTPDLDTCQTLLNGEVASDMLVALMIWGDFAPAFYMATMDRRYMQHQRAIITKAEGTLLMEVNGVSVEAYLESLGIDRGKRAEGMAAVPLLVDYRDGTMPVGRAVHALTAEGYAICSGLMPENAALAIGSLREGDVIRMAREAIERTLDSGKRGGMIIIPCGSHFLVSGGSLAGQRDVIEDLVGDKMPYIMTYSGGEICPSYDAGNAMHNHFNSFTFTAMIF